MSTRQRVYVWTCFFVMAACAVLACAVFLMGCKAVQVGAEQGSDIFHAIAGKERIVKQAPQGMTTDDLLPSRRGR